MNQTKMNLKKILVCLVAFALLSGALTIIQVKASTTPVISGLFTSSTQAGATCTFIAMFNDSAALNPNGQYIFGSNNTGIWVWGSATNFTVTPQVVEVSMQLNVSVGYVVAYCWNCTDNAGGNATSGIQTFALSGSTSTPTATPSATTIIQVQQAPTTTLFWFMVLIVFLIATAVIAYAFFPILGLFMGVIGFIGVAFFASTGVLVISQYTDPASNVTSITLMPLGLYILAPIVLCILNMLIPLIKKK